MDDPYADSLSCFEFGFSYVMYIFFAHDKRVHVWVLCCKNSFVCSWIMQWLNCQKVHFLTPPVMPKKLPWGSPKLHRTTFTGFMYVLCEHSIISRKTARYTHFSCSWSWYFGLGMKSLAFIIIIVNARFLQHPQNQVMGTSLFTCAKLKQIDRQKSRPRYLVKSISV